ncbi:YARHG domain-containing protein [Facklamia sp. P12945]|uniref:YARHG domain-containing protein n=1 Tax=Facklamia sp. P12945 TaxID=3421950 RepID=UPI003D16CE2E
MKKTLLIILSLFSLFGTLRTFAQENEMVNFYIEGLDYTGISMLPNEKIVRVSHGAFNEPPTYEYYHFTKKEVEPVEIQYMSYLENLTEIKRALSHQITIGDLVDSDKSGPLTGAIMYLRETGEDRVKLELISNFIDNYFEGEKDESYVGYMSQDSMNLTDFMAEKSVEITHPYVEDNKNVESSPSDLPPATDAAEFAKLFVGGNSTKDDSALSKEYIIPDSNQRLLTDDEVKHLDAKALCYARNEIYARKGRRFESQELQSYFNQQDWYQGTIAPSHFSDNDLTRIELDNALTLLKHEKKQGIYQPK